MGVLNFSTDNLITGVNIIDGNLYWTDDRSQPKKLEISRWRDETQVRDGVSIASNGDILNHTDVTVIRPHPYRVFDLELTEYIPTDTLPEPPFEKIFPRFSYRWRYEDGQYSPMAPFTQPAFLSQTRRLTATGTDREADGYMDSTENANYTEGFNTTLFNNVGTITLDNIPRGTRDVVAIDLLYTESISSTIYVIETIEIPVAHRGFDYIINQTRYTNRFALPGVNPVPVDSDYDLLPLRYTIRARKVYRALPPNQLLRPFDNVPRLAKSQEITANRLVYGNYLHNYDQPSSLNITTGVVAAESFPYLLPGSPEDNALRAQSNTDGLHVKGNKTYEIGVAYIDPYGRQGAMIPVGSTTNTLTGEVTVASSFVTPFNQSTRQALFTQIISEPPPWADSYRYFIKDVSMDHHNLIAYNVYNDGALTETASPYIWVEFLSTDRNKITEETILIPRRVNTSIEPTKNRHLVQEIEGEVPNVVRNQIASGPNVEYISLGLPATVGDDFDYYQNADYTGSSSLNRYGLPPLPSTIIYLTEPDGTNNGLGRANFFAALNGFLAQNRLETLEETVIGQPNDTRPQAQSVAIPFDADQQVYLQFDDGNDDDDQVNNNDYHQIRRLGFYPVNAEGESRDFLEIEFYEDINTGDITRNANLGRSQHNSFTLHTARITEEAAERLQGRFWARIARNNLASGMSTFDDEEDGEITLLHQVWFETEPEVDDSNLDLFWETSQTFCVCTEHGWPNKLDWYNSLAETTTGGVYLESQRINNQFNSVQLVKGVRVNVPQDRYAEERRFYGLTWSGIYNSRTGINRLNEFITAEGITKELEPNYGSIQKLHTRDTDLIAFTEDKVFKILADKDALFNADGNSNLTANNNVLGQTTPYIGEYGISKNPESFASYGSRIYFTDKSRGVVLRLSQNGLVEISRNGMSDYFRDEFMLVNEPLWGSYDDYSERYNIRLNTSTLAFDDDNKGWPSRRSFLPESGLTLNNVYYTFKGGRMWAHSSDTAPRNNFYGTQYCSSITTVFNQEPSVIKNFQTFNYEGTRDWTAPIILTDQEGGLVTTFLNKEGKWFERVIPIPNADIPAIVDGLITDNIDRFYDIDAYTAGVYNFSDQAGDVDGVKFLGLGVSHNISIQAIGGGYGLTFTSPLNVSLALNDVAYCGVPIDGEITAPTLVGDVTFISSNRLSITITPASGVTVPVGGSFIFIEKDKRIEASGIIGYEAMMTMKNTSTTKAELFAVSADTVESSR